MTRFLLKQPCHGLAAGLVYFCSIGGNKDNFSVCGIRLAVV
jgi:hypothetical protein